MLSRRGNLGTKWNPRMLEYGRPEHGTFRAGIGDWTMKIRSGQVQQGRPLPEPDDIPDQIKPIARAWGYLT